MGFEFSPGPLPGLVLIRPQVHRDHRGEFFEVYRESAFTAAGIPWPLVQYNHSRSVQGTLRGIHCQTEPYAQGKLVRVLSGRVWDLAVDLRPRSPSFGQWFGLELDADDPTLIYVPAGYGHALLTLSSSAEVEYGCTAEYHPECERGVRWDDPELGVA